MSDSPTDELESPIEVRIFCEPTADPACLSRWPEKIEASDPLKAHEKAASNRIPAFFQKTT